MIRKFYMMVVAAIATLACSMNAQAQEFTMDEIRAGIALLNAECPQAIDQGLTIESIVLNDNNKSMDINFVVSPESGVTASMLEMVKPQLEPMMLDQFRNGEKETKELVKMLKANDYGMRMIFSDGFGTPCIFNYPASTL